MVRWGHPSVLNPDDPSTWSREQLVGAVIYYRAKIRRLREKYEK